MKNIFKSQWALPVLFVVLSLVPSAGGIYRLFDLATAVDITPENRRFISAPIPIIVHILTATPFCILGGFQFVPSLRARDRKWHRNSGRLMVFFGVVAALSGIWMTVTYPATSEILNGFRYFFGGLMAFTLIKGVFEIRARRIANHRIWMMRGYAIGVTAGTQVLIYLPVFLLFGEPGETAGAFLLGFGWCLNLFITQLIIWRGSPSKLGAKQLDMQKTGLHPHPSAR